MTLSAYFTLKSVFDQQGCRALTFTLARLSCSYCLSHSWSVNKWIVRKVSDLKHSRCSLLCYGMLSMQIPLQQCVEFLETFGATIVEWLLRWLCVCVCVLLVNSTRSTCSTAIWQRSRCLVNWCHCIYPVRMVGLKMLIAINYHYYYLVRVARCHSQKWKIASADRSHVTEGMHNCTEKPRFICSNVYS